MRVITHISLLLVVLMYSAGLPIVNHYCHHAHHEDIGLWVAGEKCTHHQKDHETHHQQLPACCVKHTPATHLDHEDGNCCDTDGTFFKLPNYELTAFAKVLAPALLYVGWVNYDYEPLSRIANTQEFVRPPPDVGWTLGSVNDRLARVATWLL